MDEERLLMDYALPGPIGYLEVTVMVCVWSTEQCTQWVTAEVVRSR